MKLGFILGILVYLCQSCFGRLERKHYIIASTSSLRRHYNDHPSVGLETVVDAASDGPSDQPSKECWPHCPVVFTVTISQALIPLPTNAFTVTIGGNVVTQSTMAPTQTTATLSTTSGEHSSVLSDPTSTTDSTTENTSVTTSIISHPAPTISPGSITTQVNKVSTTSHSATAVASTNASSSPSTNLQTFVDALGNIPAPPVFDTGNGEFLVEGNSSFDNKQNALARSCDVQHNDCGNAANADHDVSFTVNDCDAQEAQCKAIAGS